MSKDDRGPYYPALQRELDQLVGAGLVVVDTLKAIPLGKGEIELEARFRLQSECAVPLLETIGALPDEADTALFLVELASAFLEIRPDRRDNAAIVDAAYSDPSVPQGRIVDFAEWVKPTIENPA